MMRKLSSLLCTALIAVLGLPSLPAAIWEKTTVSQGPEAGQLMATAVDRLGRIHIARLEGTIFGDDLLRYSLRGRAGDDFETTNIFAYSGTVVPLEIAMSIDSSSQRVRVVVLLSDQKVIAYEQAFGGTSWVPKTVASDASTNSLGAGVSTSGNQIVYTAAVAGSPDQISGINVATPFNEGWLVSNSPIIAGAIAAPVIIQTPGGIQGSPETRSVVVAVNPTASAVQMVRNLAGSWQAPEMIEDVSSTSFLRPTLAFSHDRLGVATVDRTSQVSFLQRLPDAGVVGEPSYSEYSWTKSTVAPASEAMGSTFASYGNVAPVAFDAGGNPLIAYTFNDIGAEGLRTVNVRVKRLIEGAGWVQDTVDTPPVVAGSEAHLTNSRGIALAMARNGDPVLAYERDLGAESEVVIARPLSAPWVLDQPHALDRPSAPAVTSGINGEFHYAVNYTATVGSTRFARGELISFSQSGIRTVPIGTSTARALTATPDGIVHMISRGISGQVSHLIIENGTGRGNTPIAESAPGELVLEADRSGALYAMLRNNDGAAEIWKRPSSGAWAKIATTPKTNLTGLDMAVDAEGGVAVSYYENFKVGMFGNVAIKSGALRASFAEISYDLPFDEGGVSDTSIAFHPDGPPLIAYPRDGQLRTLSYVSNPLLPQFDGLNESAGQGLANGSELELLFAGNTRHVLAHSPADGGTLLRLSSTDGFFEADTIAKIGLGLESQLSAALDSFGAPVVAADFGGGGVFARPADMLDDDFDGIPLLLEDAYCLNPLVAETSSFEAAIEESGTTLGSTTTYRFPAPNLPSESITGGYRYGDFNYIVEGSADLSDWSAEVSINQRRLLVEGERSLLDNLDPACRESGISLLHFEPFQEDNPSYFTRLRVERVR